MKKLFFISMVITLAAIFILNGCTNSGTTPAQVTTPAQTSATVAAAPQVFEFKWSDTFPPASDDAKLADMFCNMLTEGTGGRIKVTMYHAATLGQGNELLDMLNHNVCQMGYLIAPYFPGRFEMFAGPEVPGLGIPNRFVRANMTWELYYAGYFKDLENTVKVVAFKANPPQKLNLRDKKVMTLEDLKGLKINATNPNVNKLYGLLGATPVNVAGTEIYMDLERNMMDGASTGYDNFVGTKLYEVAKYTIWNFNSTVACMAMVMSKDAWNSLPPDVQLQVERVIDEFRGELDRYWQDKDIQAPDLLRSDGVDVYNISDTELAKWNDMASPILSQWITNMEAKGLPAGQMVDLIKKIIARYK